MLVYKLPSLAVSDPNFIDSMAIGQRMQIDINV